MLSAMLTGPLPIRSTRHIFIFVSCLMVFLLLAPMLMGQAKTVPSNDDRIYDEVRRRLADDADVKGGAIDVTVNHGAIVLKGRVHDVRARVRLFGAPGRGFQNAEPGRHFALGRGGDGGSGVDTRQPPRYKTTRVRRLLP